MNNPRTLVLISFILSVAIYRVIPHPFNFTPVLAMALFSGAKFKDLKLALLLPLIAMLLSDLFLGFHQTMFFVYGALALIVFSGIYLNKKIQRKTPVKNAFNIITASAFSSGIFFIVSNFGVWLTGNFYAKNIAGLIDCYIAAVPFLQNSIASNLFFSTLFFGGFYLAEKQFTQLQETPS